MKGKMHASLGIVLLVCDAVAASTLYVSQNSPFPAPPYATWDTAAHTVQEAVDAASDGDTVLVAPGQYGLTNQVTVAKAIALRSTMGAGQTFLTSLSNIWCLWISNSLAVADGFTMQKASFPLFSRLAGGAYLVGGTVQNCNFANFTGPRLGASVVMVGGILSNSIVTYSRPPDGNSAVYCSGGGLITDCQILCKSGLDAGMGVYLVDSQLRNSIISGAGGGIHSSGAAVHALSSTIAGCTITGNYNAAGRGGGAYLDGCLMDRCIVAGNSSGDAGGRGRGGGIFATNSIIRDSLIVSNGTGATSAEPSFGGLGGGVYMQGGALVNCTVSANRVHSGIYAPGQGGGIYVESGVVRNSIVYFNSAGSNANWYNGGGSFDHTCTTPDPGGVGNIVEDPQFVDRANGNYRLAPASPCIDAGVNEPWMSGARDLDGYPRIMNGTVDLGAWESTNRPPVMPVVTWIAPTNQSSFPAGSAIRMSARATDSDGSVSFVEFFANSTNLGQVVSATGVYEFVWSNAPSGTFRLHAEAVDNTGGRGTSDSVPELAVLIVVGATEPPAILSNPSPDAYDAFGNSVAISGTYAVVGIDVHNTRAAESGGAAYVYDLASATPTTPARILTNPSTGMDVFGWSVAISGTYVVVGAPFDDTGPGATSLAPYGSAYVYDLASATPTVPMATLNNPHPTPLGRFGWSVAISGTLVVVGDPADGTGAQRAGSAYVYDMASVTPTVPVATLNNPSPGAGDAFGNSVAISGTRVVVAAQGDDNTAVNDGTVYVYDLTSGIPTAPVLTFTNPSPTTAQDRFGSSVAISGTRVVVGDTHQEPGPMPPPPPVEPGSVYVYDLASATPTVPVTTIDNPYSGPALDGFAFSVAISGTRVVVGAHHHEVDQTGRSGPGSAYVYDLASATPTVPVTTLTNPSPATIDYSDQFGYSVAVSGTRVLVGAIHDDAGANNAGNAYLYDFAIASPPLMRFAQPQGNGGTFRSIVGGLPPQGTIIVETSSDLINWQPLQTNTVSSGSFELVVPINRSNPAQFWRALVQY